MNIQSSLRNRGSRPHSHKASKTRPCSDQSQNSAVGADAYVASESFGPRFLGGFVGAVVGGIAGAAGSQSAMLSSGLGAGIVTAATLGPHLAGAVKSGLNGDPLNDTALTTSAIFAGGVTLTAFSAAAGLGAYALDQAVPGAGRIISAAMGAAAGASVGIWN